MLYYRYSQGKEQNKSKSTELVKILDELAVEIVLLKLLSLKISNSSRGLTVSAPPHKFKMKWS